jgi:hypothetical protein
MVARVFLLSFVFAAFTTATSLGAPAAVVVNKPSLVCPQTEVGSDSLQARYTGMWGQYTTSVDEATKKLQQEFERQSKKATAAGNLDLVLFWKGLAKKFEQTGEVTWEASSQKKTWNDRFGDAPFPEEFTVTVKNASEAYSSAKTSLENAYNSLVGELTKAEELDKALKVRAEIKTLLAEKVVISEQEQSQKKKKTEEEQKPTPVSPLVGLWVGEMGWGNEFFADKTAKNLTPRGEADVIGTWKDDGQGRYSALLGSWQWQIVLRGDEIHVTRYHNGQLKSTGTLRRSAQSPAQDPVIGQWQWFNGGVKNVLANGQIAGHPDASWHRPDPKARRYIFSWGNGRFIDNLFLAPNGSRLAGKNQEGADVSGQRVR